MTITAREFKLFWLSVIIGVLLVFLAQAALAQTPATRGHSLADAAMVSNVTMQAFITCMEAGQKEGTCKKIAFREAERSEKVAKQVSKAIRQGGIAPAGWYTLADAAMVSDINMRAFIACRATPASEGTCEDLADREAKRSEEVAKQVAKSTDPYDPCSSWNPPRGCIYQYGGYGGYGYGSPGAYQPRQRGPAYGGNTQPRPSRGQAVPRGSAYGGNGGNGYSENTPFIPGASGSGMNGNGSAGNTAFIPGASGSGTNGNGSAANREFVPGTSGHSGTSGSGGNTNGTGGNIRR